MGETLGRPQGGWERPGGRGQSHHGERADAGKDLMRGVPRTPGEMPGKSPLATLTYLQRGEMTMGETPGTRGGRTDQEKPGQSDWTGEAVRMVKLGWLEEPKSRECMSRSAELGRTGGIGSDGGNRLPRSGTDASGRIIQGSQGLG